MYGGTFLKKFVFTFLLLILCLQAGMAGAEGQENPGRKAAVEAEKFAQEVCAQREEGKGSVRSNDSGNGLLITCNRQPSLNGTGSWTIGLIGHTPSDVQRMYCYLGCKDWSGSYTHLHWINKDREDGETNPFMSSYTTPKFVTAGSYQLMIHVIYKNRTSAWYEHYFTISGTNVLQNRINSVAAACRADTDWQTALNLHDWLTHNMYYDYSYQYYGADSILRGYGVCDSYAKAYLMLCRAAGIPVYRVTNDTHAWNAVMLDGEWFYVDCTWDDPGGVKEGTSGSEKHDYFCLNDTLLGMDHPLPWNWSFYSRQPCESLDANYLIHTGEWKTWGINYIYNAAGKTYRVIPFSEEIANAINNGSAAVNFENATWWSGGGAGIRGTRPNDYKRICLVYALNRESIPVPEADRAWVSAVWQKSDNSITVRLTGWDIPETGTLTLPKNLKIVPEEAFQGSGATTLVIPSGCETIRGNAFKDSRLRTVTVPDSVIQIADNAFDGCGKIIFRTASPAALRFAAEHRIPVLSP